jgi:hypothetical protein
MGSEEIAAPNQHAAAVHYAQQLTDRQRDFEDAETSVVVTTDSLPAHLLAS